MNRQRESGKPHEMLAAMRPPREPEKTAETAGPRDSLPLSRDASNRAKTATTNPHAISLLPHSFPASRRLPLFVVAARKRSREAGSMPHRGVSSQRKSGLVE